MGRAARRLPRFSPPGEAARALWETQVSEFSIVFGSPVSARHLRKERLIRLFAATHSRKRFST